MTDPYRPARLLLEARRQGVTDPAVLQALERVSRADFVAPDLADLAYEDCALPIGCGQTLYSPILAGQLLQALAIEPGGGNSVFLVGAGSGYTMALAAQIAGKVAGIDRFYGLIDGASQALSARGEAGNYRFYHGDGLSGLATGEMFDRILVAGAVDEIPSALMRALSRDGRLVVPGLDGEHGRVRVLCGDGTQFEHPLSRPVSPMMSGAARRL